MHKKVLLNQDSNFVAYVLIIATCKGHDVLDILKRDGAKTSLKRNRAKAAVNSAFRAELLAF